MTRVNRPLTGAEIQCYALSTWPAAEVDGVMAALVADELVTAAESYHPNGRHRRTRSYSLAAGRAEGGEG